jgi:hypothetical protein
MNVKSRAQLIVWCLPHIGFVEKEERAAEAAAAAGAAAPAAAQGTIPAGSAPIVGTSGGFRGSNDLGI